MPKGRVTNIEVVDAATAETADLMVCMRLPDTSGFTDNMTSACTQCGAGIYFRPYAPRRVRRVCTRCALALIW